jgi:uncharacterized protein (UPF0305 family)
MKYWSRDDTKEWIIQLEHRIEDIEYYLDRTSEWCDEYGIDNGKVIFMCSFITCIWVSYMRNEPITFIELMELLGVDNWEADEEKIYELDDRWGELDHYDLLEKVVETFSKDE